MSVTVFDNMFPQLQEDLVWLGVARNEAIQGLDVEFQLLCTRFDVFEYSRNGANGVSGIVGGHKIFAEFDRVQSEWAITRKSRDDEDELKKKFLSFIYEMTVLNLKVVDRIKAEVDKNERMRYLGSELSSLGHLVISVEYLGTVPGLISIPDEMSEPILFMSLPRRV